MMGRVRCIICGEKIPPEDLDSFRGEPLCTKPSNLIAMEIARLRVTHKRADETPTAAEERLRNWAKTLGQTTEPERLDIDQKETDLAFEVMKRIDKSIEQLGIGVTVEKVDPRTLRLLYLKLDELERCVSKGKKPIVDTLAGWARRLR